MGFYYFKCRSVTYAQRASKFLHNKGIYTGIVKLPLKYSNEGCGYSLKVSERQFSKAKALLGEAGYEINKLYYSDDNAQFKEVAL